MLDSIYLEATTDASGDATVTSERGVFGLLYAVQWVDGDLADNNTAVLSVINTDSAVNQTLHTQVAGEGDDDTWYYPRILAHDNSAVQLTSPNTYTYMVLNGTLQLVVAAGGNAKTGGAIVYFLE